MKADQLNAFNTLVPLIDGGTSVRDIFRERHQTLKLYEPT